MNQPRLHVIVDVTPNGPDAIVLSRLVIQGGAPLIQLRPKGVTDHAAYEVACRVADLCADANVNLIINDRTDIAEAVGAAGVHLGAQDLPVAVARQLLGPSALVGGTARDAQTASVHQLDGASYVGVGPIFPTSSKIGLPDPLGVDVIASVAAAVAIPIIAISGVTVERVDELMAAGAHGVAVIGAVRRADAPEAAVRAFMHAIDQALMRHG